MLNSGNAKVVPRTWTNYLLIEILASSKMGSGFCCCLLDSGFCCCLLSLQFDSTSRVYGTSKILRRIASLTTMVERVTLPFFLWIMGFLLFGVRPSTWNSRSFFHAQSIGLRYPEGSQPKRLHGFHCPLSGKVLRDQHHFLGQWVREGWCRVQKALDSTRQGWISFG